MRLFEEQTTIELACSGILLVAVIHTFSVRFFNQLATKFKSGSIFENIFHLLGEVEVVFGFWAAIFLGVYCFIDSKDAASGYLQSLNFTEPAFVFVIVVVCSTKPILFFTEKFISIGANALPIPRAQAFYLAAMILGPLLGSFITEPAAMAVTALLLLDRFYKNPVSEKFKYATLGLLFVNISIGGVLTPYAAPPVLMVAKAWNLDLATMFFEYGWRSFLAVVANTMLYAWYFRKEFSGHKLSASNSPYKTPPWMVLVHLLFLTFIVIYAHHVYIFAGIFLFFIAVYSVTREHQSKLKIREGLLVMFFLGGIVILGRLQSWWLTPILLSLDDFSLMLGATLLTAITDNAAITYLGSQVEGLSEVSKHALLSGAVVGGGLTVIANAPNPVGYGILNSQFGKSGINPLKLFLAAIIPTLIAFACFWF